MKPLIKLTFTPEDIEQLHHERFHHPHPRVQRKMEALYLKSQVLPELPWLPLDMELSHFQEMNDSG